MYHQGLCLILQDHQLVVQFRHIRRVIQDIGPRGIGIIQVLLEGLEAELRQGEFVFSF